MLTFRENKWAKNLLSTDLYKKELQKELRTIKKQIELDKNSNLLKQSA